MPTIADEELARQTQAGSLEAFEQLVHRYEHRLHAFAKQFCPNTIDAREVTQDTLVKAFQCIGQFDSRRMFAAWLFTIARRKCIDRHRAAPRAEAGEAMETVEAPGPAELIERREAGENLWGLARRRLGENQYQALWLHYAEDMDVAQIAEVLGKSRVGVKVLLFRARQVLGRELKRGGAEANQTEGGGFVGQTAIGRRTNKILTTL